MADCREILDMIDEKVGNLSDSEKSRFIAMNMIYYVAENDSQYTYLGEAAGGLNVSGIEGDSSSKLQDTEAITQYNGKIDVILNFTTKDCVNIDPSTLWENRNIDKIQNSDTFENMVVNQDISIVIVSSPTKVAPSLVVPIINAGIKGVLNFTSTPLNFPQGIVVENYDITTLLEKVAYFVKENEESNSSNA